MEHIIEKRDTAISIVGTLIPEELFYEIQSKSRVSAASSPIFMQRNIFTGLKEVCENVSFFSYPPIAVFPGSSVLLTKSQKLFINNECSVSQIFIVNLPGLKQISVFGGMLTRLVRWAISNRNNNRYILTYADFLEYCLPALFVGKLFKIPVSLFLTELPGFEHYHHGRKTIKDQIVIISEKLKTRLYLKYNGFVFVSQHLKDVVPVHNAPYTVVEGFAEDDLFSNEQVEKEKTKTIMYAGSLGEAYNIKNICDAFHSIQGNYSLWVFGDGKYREYVERIKESDNRIKYFGKVTRNEVLSYERKAHLLLHAKTSSDQHSKYAFSSKILEYMASGTPVLTTRVDGVPEEYYKYSFVIEDDSIEGLASSIKNALDLSNSDLEEVGKRAKSFVLNNKNKEAQALKIINMMHRIH